MSNVVCSGIRAVKAAGANMFRQLLPVPNFLNHQSHLFKLNPLVLRQGRKGGVYNYAKVLNQLEGVGDKVFLVWLMACKFTGRQGARWCMVKSMCSCEQYEGTTISFFFLFSFLSCVAWEMYPQYALNLYHTEMLVASGKLAVSKTDD